MFNGVCPLRTDSQTEVLSRLTPKMAAVIRLLVLSSRLSNKSIGQLGLAISMFGGFTACGENELTRECTLSINHSGSYFR